MEKNHLDNDFTKIAELFQKYEIVLSSNNTASAIDGFKDKIVVQFWKTIQKAAISEEMKEQSDLIVNKIVYCLGKYSDKEPEDFCKLTYASIMKALKSKADIDEFEKKSGMHITDPENRLRKRIEKAHKQYLMFNEDDDLAFIEYAITYLGFEKKDVQEYLTPKRSISLFTYNKNDNEEYCIADKYANTTTSTNFADVSDSQEKLAINLKKIDKIWSKQKDEAKAVLSELMTRELLSDFSKNNVSETLIETLKSTDFICKEMICDFFNNSEYKLPSQQEVGEKYGLTKSAASVKLKRFVDSIKKQ